MNHFIFILGYALFVTSISLALPTFSAQAETNNQDCRSYKTKAALLRTGVRNETNRLDAVKRSVAQQNQTVAKLEREFETARRKLSEALTLRSQTEKKLGQMQVDLNVTKREAQAAGCSI